MNFPVHVALAKIAPALATGNSVILKPSEIAPLACLRLAELAAEAGVPPGVLNALPGQGEHAGKYLALHMDVDCLAFVGSTQTGLKLMQYAGQSNMKALLLECGGKSPQIVLDDLGDPEGLCDALVQGFTWNSGQVCVSGSRLLIASSVYDTLRPILQEKVRALAIADPLDPDTALAPCRLLCRRPRFGSLSRIPATQPNASRPGAMHQGRNVPSRRICSRRKTHPPGWCRRKYSARSAR